MSRYCEDLQAANEALRSLMVDAEKEALVRAVVTEVKSMLANVSLRIDYKNASAVFHMDETGSNDSPTLNPGLMLAVNENPGIANAVAPLIQVERLIGKVSEEPVSFEGEISNTEEFRSYSDVHGLEIPERSTKDVVVEFHHRATDYTAWRSRGIAQIVRPGQGALDVIFEIRRRGVHPFSFFAETNLELASLLHAASQPNASTGLARCPFVGFVPVLFEADGHLSYQKYSAAAFCFEIPKALQRKLGGGEPPFQSFFERLEDQQAPPLGVRFRIAQLLAREYYNFVETGWLHKGIRSHNILFWRSEDSAGFECEPHLLGFGYARANPDSRVADMSDKEPIGPTIAPYLHPIYRKNAERMNYRLTFDLYSLAVVLIELAFWTPAFPDSGPDFPALHVLQTGQFSDGELTDLCIRMGTRYAGAVQTLLTGGLVMNAIAPMSLAKISRRFSELVLKPLEECCA